jgi:RNA polymerase sigma-32 factor
MTSPASLALNVSKEGLTRYLSEIRKFPLLQPEQENAYAKRWRDHQDRDAAYHLVTSHLRLAAKIAMKFRGYGLPVADVISEANIGLMQAVRRFDPDRGVRLATYAMWWIKASIHEYVLRTWSIVKMSASASQKKLFFGLRRLKSRIAALDDCDLQPEQLKTIAEHLKIAEKEVVEVNRRLRGDLSLNIPVGEDDRASELLDRLSDPAATPETTIAESQEYQFRQSALKTALTTLNARERRIVEARFLSEEALTLDSLSAEFGVSRERIRQIERRAFQKIQAAVRRLTESGAVSAVKTIQSNGRSEK